MEDIQDSQAEHRRQAVGSKPAIIGNQCSASARHRVGATKWHWIYAGRFHMGTHKWMIFVRENPNLKWMMTRGTPIYGPPSPNFSHNFYVLVPTFWRVIVFRSRGSPYWKGNLHTYAEWLKRGFATPLLNGDLIARNPWWSSVSMLIYCRVRGAEDGWRWRWMRIDR